MTQVLDYRPAPYVPVPAGRRWWPLARQEATVLFRSRLGIGLFFVCLIPAFVRLAMLLIAFGVLHIGPPGLRNVGLRPTGGQWARFDPRRVEFYLEPVLAVLPGMVFALLLSTLVIARSVARDRPTNALELYWTRGISPRAYVLGKWLGGALLLGMLTVAVPAVLWLVAVFLAEDWSLLTEGAGGMALALLGLVLVTAVWAGIGTLLSAAAATPNGAMIVWTVLLFGGSAVGAILARTLREPELLTTLSVWHAGGAIVRAIAAVPDRGDTVLGAALLLALVLAAAWLRARRHLRVGEAVG